MSLVMTSGPALEPVTLAEAKAHLRIDHANEDALIQSLIITSRLHIEAAVGLALITQSWSHYVDRWPTGAQRMTLPMRPIQSISAVRLWNTDNTNVTLPSTLFYVDGQGLPARLGWHYTPANPQRTTNGIEIAFTAGYGSAAANVPEPIRHALLLLVAHWYEHRDPLEIGAKGIAIPAMVSDLLVPYRRRRLA